MEKEKNKLGIIILLSVVVIILSVLCILFATDKIIFNNKNDEINNNNVINNEKVENLRKEVTINNSLLNEKTLKELLMIVGISTDKNTSNDSLNLALTTRTYNEYTYLGKQLEVFSHYAESKNLTYYNDELDEKCINSIECSQIIGGMSSDSKFILKKDALEILRTYNYNIEDIVFLKEIPVSEDVYYFLGSSLHNFSPWIINHDVTTKNVNDADVVIVDNQVIYEVEYVDDTDDNIKIISTKKQTVTYEYKKDNAGRYYLNNVEVEY